MCDICINKSNISNEIDDYLLIDNIHNTNNWGTLRNTSMCWIFSGIDSRIYFVEF